MLNRILSLTFVYFLFQNSISAQRTDTTKSKFPDPKKATLRSLILPGWGQAYNKQYWKIPIAVGAVTIPAVLFFDNKSDRKTAQKNYEILLHAVDNSGQIDLQKINQLDAAYLTAFKKSNNRDALLGAIQNQRNQFRRNQDYAALWFFILWGLNVADAAVSAHLKHFDISPNLSMQTNLYSNNLLATLKLRWKY
ncbi:DUF5683 domain-containing protein [Rhizosphaericola mali]|uniref:DUF5683 domain-containing protein n=1 Tax=Rhizosphaericola mali TaxID=2545455 RepID=A0A5P2G9G3_9BACT|nr:DUF5683 domain-containing protein [Rhizosphaericola mali]QES88161.1 hypothetical protein E0W69_005600 [Rhizosphaericola mali]